MTSSWTHAGVVTVVKHLWKIRFFFHLKKYVRCKYFFNNSGDEITMIMIIVW